MSQNTKQTKGARASKRKMNVAADPKISESSRKRGRTSKQQNKIAPTPAAMSKNLKTVMKTPEAVKELTPVTPTETPPSADVVPKKTTRNKNTKQQKQLQTPSRSNPPREVRNAPRVLQLQKTVAPILLKKSQPKGKNQRGRLQKKHNGHALKKTKDQLFLPETDTVEAVANCDDVANNNDGYMLAQEVEVQYYYV